MKQTNANDKFEKTLNQLIQRYIKLYRQNFATWDEMTKLDKKNDPELFKIFEEYSELRSQILRYAISSSCDTCDLNMSGSTQVKSDVDVGIGVSRDPSTIGSKNHFVSDVIERINEMISERIMEIVENMDDKKTISEDLKNMLMLKDENMLSMLFDINIYGHTFYFKKKENFTEEMEGLYYYDFYKILRTENENEKQKIYAYFVIFKENNNKYTGLIPKRYEEAVRELYERKLSKIKDENAYLKQLKNTEMKMISYNASVYDIINSISECDLYSVDSYCTYGAFMHVVFMRQMKMKIDIPKLCYQHSMIEHFGKVIHILLHEYKKENSENVKLQQIIKASKYLMRFYDAINLYTDGIYQLTKEKFWFFNYISRNYRHDANQYNLNESTGSAIYKSVLNLYITDSIDSIIDQIKNDFKKFNDDYYKDFELLDTNSQESYSNEYTESLMNQTKK